MSELDDLAHTLSLLARPGLTVEADGRDLRLRLSSMSEPRHELMVLVLRPLSDDISAQRSSIIQSFNEFNDVAAITVDRATPVDDPLSLVQDIYNRGVMLNGHGWVDAFDFEILRADTDIAHWAHRTY